MFTLKELFAIVTFLAIVFFCLAKAMDTSVSIVFAASVAMVVLVNVFAGDSFRTTYVYTYVCLIVAVMMAIGSSIPHVSSMVQWYWPPPLISSLSSPAMPGSSSNMDEFDVVEAFQNRKLVVLSSLMIVIPYLSARIRDAAYSRTTQKRSGSSAGEKRSTVG